MLINNVYNSMVLRWHESTVSKSIFCALNAFVNMNIKMMMQTDSGYEIMLTTALCTLIEQGTIRKVFPYSDSPYQYGLHTRSANCSWSICKKNPLRHHYLHIIFDIILYTWNALWTNHNISLMIRLMVAWSDEIIRTPLNSVFFMQTFWLLATAIKRHISLIDDFSFCKMKMMNTNEWTSFLSVKYA